MSELFYSVDGQQCDAQSFYQLACHPERNVVVEACAGAGKTWILVARMARALLQGAAPDQILAITFTKKAAAEMRARLFELLLEWSQADDAGIKTSLSQRGVRDADAAMVGRARGLYAQLLSSPTDVQVKTFHSWFAQLLRLAPIEALRQLGLPPQYELLEQDSALKQHAWGEFLVQMDATDELRQLYLDAVAYSGRGAVEKALLRALDWRVELVLAEHAGVLANSVRPPLEVEPRWSGVYADHEVMSREPDFYAALQAAAVSLGQSPRSEASRKSGTKLEIALSAGDMATVWDVLRTAKGERRIKGLGAKDPEVLEAAQEYLDSWGRLKHQHACYLHQQRLSKLSLALIDAYTKVKRGRGLVDMVDLESAAVSLLSEGPVADWIQERLGQKVRHILIDEFQDTNPMQWQAFRSWLGAYAGAGGGGGLNVFLVGDPKQSIYRFRRADPRVFTQARDFLVAGLGANVLACDHTRRCARKVVEVLNAVMPEVAAFGETAASFRPHSTSSDVAGEVLCLPLTGDASDPSGDEPSQASAKKPDIWRDTFEASKFEVSIRGAITEARAVAVWLKRAIDQGRVAPDDVLILARKRDSLDLTSQALTELGVANAYTEKTLLSDAPVVRDVLAFVEVAALGVGDMAMAHVLKSPWMGASDDDLLAVAAAKKQGGFQSWWETLTRADLSQHKPSARTDDDWQRTWQAWRQVCLMLAHDLQTLPMQDALIRLFDAVQAEEAYLRCVPASARRQAQLQLAALLDASQSIQSGRFLTPLQWVHELRHNAQEVSWPSPEQSVRLMTVHGAKGLEAPWVVLMDAHAPPRASGSNEVLLDWPPESAKPARVIFVAKEKKPPICTQSLFEREMWAREAENSNLLYVAMTRAGERLIVSGRLGSRNAEGSWYEVIQACGVTAEPLSDERAAVAPALDDSSELKVLPAYQPKFSHLHPVTQSRALQSELSEPSPVDTDRASSLGEAMHQLLQWWAPDRGWSEGMKRQVRRQWNLSDAELEEVSSWARAIVQGDAAWTWDSAQVARAYAEVEVRWQGELVRMDRVVQDKQGAWLILDFKSSRYPNQQPEGVEQVKRYVQAWSAAYPNAVVKGSLVGSDGHLWPVNA